MQQGYGFILFRMYSLMRFSSAFLPASSMFFYLKETVSKGGICQFSFSENGTKFTNVGEPFTAKPDK